MGVHLMAPSYSPAIKSWPPDSPRPVTAWLRDVGGHWSHVESDTWCQCWVSEQNRKVRGRDFAFCQLNDSEMEGGREGVCVWGYAGVEDRKKVKECDTEILKRKGVRKEKHQLCKHSHRCYASWESVGFTRELRSPPPLTAHKPKQWEECFILGPGWFLALNPKIVFIPSRYITCY